MLIDTLDGRSAARRAQGAGGRARIADGGSLTVIATARAPFGGETTVIALDAGARPRTRPLPGARPARPAARCAPELLVGEDGAEAIAKARAEALAAASRAQAACGGW